jgi:hypothetical protein
MARRYYGLDQGQTEFQVSEGAASPSKAIEVNFDLAVGLKEEEVLRALEMIKNHIISGLYPPA